ncbi:Tn3 family transposase [Acidiphilium acidophilum]|uniref:Tn3 family transposase n=1 Tax=Acidiphilium acidophilum TaxID=76588 RepID=UPI0038D15092
MAEVCGAGSRRALLRMQTWHMREETFRAALACLTDAIHAEPIAAWFGQGHRASADGQTFYLGGPGEAGGAINAHYGRDGGQDLHHHHRSVRATSPDCDRRHGRGSYPCSRRHSRS